MVKANPMLEPLSNWQEAIQPSQEEEAAATDSRTPPVAEDTDGTLDNTNECVCPSPVQGHDPLSDSTDQKQEHLILRAAVVWMAMASGLHFAAYEWARNAVMTLLTSQQLTPTGGMNSMWIVSMAMACLSPVAVLFLWIYTCLLDRIGPRKALLYSTLSFAQVLAAGGLLLELTFPVDDVDNSTLYGSAWRFLPLWSRDVRLSQVVIFVLFVSVHSFVQLLSTQHWSYLNSVLASRKNDETSTIQVWFSLVAGLGSLASTLSAATIPFLIPAVIHSLTQLLLLASGLLLLTAYCSDQAYRVAHEHQLMILPHPAGSTKVDDKYDDNANRGNNDDTRQRRNNYHKSASSLSHRAQQLFQRIPILSALCIETFLYQCQSSLVSHHFVVSTKDSIPNDQDRSRITGHIYASINFSSGMMQFFIVPWLLKHVNRQNLWMTTPMLMTLLTAVLAFRQQEQQHQQPMMQQLSFDHEQQQPDHLSLSSRLQSSLLGQWLLQNPVWIGAVLCYMLLKIQEYSLRSVLVEMVYVPLDFESRFVGKEIIGLVASRVGKSAMALLLAIWSWWDEQSCRNYVPQVVLALTLVWLVASFELRQALPTSALR